MGEPRIIGGETMTPRFRAYDSGSLCRMYRPEEVLVCDDNIWVIDEDSWGNEWLLNNDLNLMQSTWFRDKNGKEIFEGDIIDSTDGFMTGVVEFRESLGMLVSNLVEYNNFERLCNVASSRKIIGNIWEHPELAEVKQ